MERVNGWAEVLQRLGDAERGMAPPLFVHARCAQLVECPPGLHYGPKRPGDVFKVDSDEKGLVLG